MANSIFTNKEVRSSRILYTPSNFARVNLIYLQEIGELEALSPHVSKREDMRSFLFFIVTKGSGRLVYQENEYTLHKGDCVFIDCRKYYSQCSSEDLWSLKWCHFYGSNLINIYNKYVERGGYSVFQPHDIDVFEDILDRMFNIANSHNDHTRDMKIYNQLVCLLTHIMEESWHPESKSKQINRRDVHEIRLYIDEHFGEKITLDAIAQHFFINKTYLTRIFKEQYGMTVNNYINQVRITKAKEMLRFTDLYVELIGEKCGIDDPNYFSRLFKKVEGVSPGIYRKQWKSGNK